MVSAKIEELSDDDINNNNNTHSEETSNDANEIADADEAISIDSMLTDDEELEDGDNFDNNVSNQDIQSVCEVELKNYRRQSQIPTHKDQRKTQWNNPLDWWKTHENRFPILARIAKSYLAIEATSASSERIFSKASRITTRDRNRLSPDMVGCLMYISSNLDWWEEFKEKESYDEITDSYL